MKRGLGMSAKEMGDTFAEWNKGVLDSFLIEITRDILYFMDDDKKPLLEKIMDSAGQKGTGKWTAINALDLGMPVTLIGEAVFARCLSSLKEERTRASKLLTGPAIPEFKGDKKEVLANLEQALYASKIISYAQGFLLIQDVRCALLRTISTALPQKLTNSFTGWKTIQVEAQQARDCTHVARRLHYPLRVLKGHHESIPGQPGSGKPAFQ